MVFCTQDVVDAQQQGIIFTAEVEIWTIRETRFIEIGQGGFEIGSAQTHWMTEQAPNVLVSDILVFIFLMKINLNLVAQYHQ